MSSELSTILEEQNVAQENAKMLLSAFGAPFEEAGEILRDYRFDDDGNLIPTKETIVVTQEDQFDLMAEASDKRKALKKIRSSVENKRKELKADSLRTGQAIDSIAKRVKNAIEPAEKYLEMQEKFAELKQAEREAKLKTERVEKLLAYTDDISLYNIDSMNQEQFDSLLASLKSAHEAAIEAEKKAEADRLAAAEAEKKRQAEIEAENIKLKKEAEAAEAQREKERAAELKKQEAIEAERAAERKAEQEKLDKIQAEKDAEIKAEREKREAIEAEQAAKIALESKQKADAEEARREALLAPDKNKLIEFANQIDAIELPNVQNREAGKLLDETQDFLDRISKNLRSKAKEL